MADIIVAKRVFFVGAWRAQTITDHLLRQISAQMSSKKGYPTNLNLTNDGLQLFILNSSGKTTRTDTISLQNTVDIVANKYSNSCMLAIVRDPSVPLFTVFGFLVSSKSDCDEMISAYRDARKRMNMTQGNTRTVTTKTTKTTSNVQTPAPVHVRVENQSAGNVITMNGMESRGNSEVKYHVVQSGARPNNDNASITTNSSDMRDELASLTKEVRDIKLMLRESKGQDHVETTHYGFARSPEPDPNQLLVSTNANMKIYDEVAEQRPSTKQRIYQKNVQYTNRNMAPGYMVVQGDLSRDRTGSVGKMSQVSSASRYSNRRYGATADIDARLQRSVNQRPAMVRVVKGSKTKLVPSVLLRTSKGGHYSDTVRKNIEDVYRSKKFRRPIAVPVVMNPQSAEYYQNTEVPASSSTVRNEEVTFRRATSSEMQHNTTTEVKTRNTEGNNVHFVKVDTDEAVLTNYDNIVQVVEADQMIANTSENSDENANVLDTSTTTIERHLELIDTLEDDGNADYEPVTFSENVENTESHTVVNVMTEETHIDTSARNRVVIETSNSDGNVVHLEPGDIGENVIQKEVTFSVKTEIITHENEVEDEEGEIPIIVPETVDRYYSDEENEDTDDENTVEFLKRNFKDSRRIGYMDELKNSITDKRGLFEDTNNNENVEIQEDNYVLDVDNLKRFSAEPNIVIVSKEEERVIKTNVNGDINAYESAELDLEVNRGEDTVLF